MNSDAAAQIARRIQPEALQEKIACCGWCGHTEIAEALKKHGAL